MRWRYFFLSISILAQTCFAQQKGNSAAVYLPTVESLKTRLTPAWFANAKFGIFIHWGLYSVPCWATPTTTPDKVTDWNYFYTNNPYAEWYLNTLRINGSPTQSYHAKNYGAGFDYYDFAKPFNAGVQNWNAAAWADLFKAAGAKYVVLTAKHHDGFTLYPSSVQHPLMPKNKINSPKDLLKALQAATQKVGLKFGIYYSGGLDWSFTSTPITKIWPDLFENMPKSVAYTAYADMQLYELIHRYKPDVLWNDVNYPVGGDILGIFAELVNANPNAVINDRWGKFRELTDFDTPEYLVLDSITKRKWESCRGIGYSFGYNRLEDERQYLSSDQLVDMLVDIVSKNGNLLLNVGPMLNGKIPDAQASRLLEMGQWLKVNGDAIYDTHPWVKAASATPDSLRVRFTQNENSLFAILLDKPKTENITLPGMQLCQNSVIKLLGYNTPISWKQKDNGILIHYPVNSQLRYAYVLKISPK